MKKQTKTVVAAKRPRTYKKSDLPRTARAYINGMGGTCYTKENEAVARLIELHAALRSDYEFAMAELVKPAVELPENIDKIIYAMTKGKQRNLTLREKFLAWIGVKP